MQAPTNARSKSTCFLHTNTYLEATDSVHLQTQVTFEIAQDARQTMQF